MSGDMAAELAGKYRIIGSLGTGAGGETFEAVAETDGAKVALKRLVLATTSDWKKVELFQREAKVLGSLHHPSIPKLRESFVVETEQGPVSYLAHDFAPGKSLRGWVEDGWHPNEAEIVRIGAFLLDVLAYLHALHPAVIHRDVKPANVIRSEDGRLWLVDFGAVRDATTTLAGSSTVVGTYGYMAPEQFRGQALPASDVYGVGATLLYLLGGKAPTEYPQEKLKIAFRNQLRVSPVLARWLDRALEPHPEERFPDAAEAAAVLRGERPAAPEPRGTRARALGAVLAIVVITLLTANARYITGFIRGFAYGLARGARHPAPPVAKTTPSAPGRITRLPPRPSSPAKTLVGGTKLEGQHPQVITGIALSPDGKRAVSTSGASVKIWDVERGQPLFSLTHEGKAGNVVYAHDGTRFVTIGGASARIWDAKTAAEIATIRLPSQAADCALTPDDKTLFIAGYDSKVVYVYDLATQTKVRELTHGAWPYAVAVTPDGTMVASGANDGSVKLWTVADGKLLRTWRPHASTINEIAFAPDGSMIATASDDRTVSVESFTTAKSEPRYAIRHKDEAWGVTFSPDGRFVVTSSKDGALRVTAAIEGTPLDDYETGVPSSHTAFTRDGRTMLAVGGLNVARFGFARHGIGTVLPTPGPKAIAAPIAKNAAHGRYLEAERLAIDWPATPLGAAEAKVAEAMRLDSQSPLPWVANARLELRRSYLSDDRYKPAGIIAAQESLDHAATRGPKGVEYWYSAEWIARANKDFAGAHEAIRQAFAIDPNDVDAKLAAAGLASIEKRHEDVVSLTTDAIHALRQPERLHRAYMLLAGAYLELGDLDAADAAHHAVLANSTQNAWDHGNYAAFLLDDNEPSKAVAEARASLAIMDYGVGRATLARALTEEGHVFLWLQNDKDAAERNYTEVLKIDPDKADALYGRAALARVRAIDGHDPGLLGSARRDLERAAQLVPSWDLPARALSELDAVEARAAK